MEELTRMCPMCGKVTTIKIEGKERIKQMSKYVVYGSQLGLIQDALSLFTPFEREFVKTGYCQKCQDMLFNFNFDNDYEDEEDIGLELKD